MKKKWISKVLNFWRKPLTKVIFYLIILILIFMISGSINKAQNNETLLEFIKEVLTQPETISFFVVGIFTIIVATIVTGLEKRMEESLKIESDHHKIIGQYKGHKKDKISVEQNYYNQNGIFMELHHTKEYKKPLANPEKDKYSPRFQTLEEELKLYNEHGVLILPSVNIFANILGNVKVNFNDKSDVKKLPEFIIGNGTEFIKAHKYSNLANNLTIRLDDISFENNILQLLLYRL